MKNWTGLLFSLLFTGVAHAAAYDGVFFETTPSKLLPVTQVGDSVFWYKSSEIECDPKADKETPCLAKVDHWDNVCFKGPMENVCSALDALFKDSREQLMNDGAEEDVELLSCSIDSGVPTVSYNLWSFHGGPNVVVKDKWILMCPIFVK